MYIIKDWCKTFENADTRKRMRLGWFLCPSGNDSAGYIELMSHGERGIMAYAVFIAMCQWSATCVPDVRGKVARSSGRPAHIRQIAAILRMPEAVVRDALELLCSDEIGWMQFDGDGENPVNPRENAECASHLPVVCQSSAGRVPQGEGKGEGKGEDISSADRGRYSEDFENFWSRFPKTRRTKKGEAYRRWRVIVRTTPASVLISKAAEYAQSERGLSEYAVMPSVWLNGRMWEDEPEAWTMAKAATVASDYKPPSERNRDPKQVFEFERSKLVKRARSENWDDDRLRAAIERIRPKEVADAL